MSKNEHCLTVMMQKHPEMAWRTCDYVWVCWEVENVTIFCASQLQQAEKEWLLCSHMVLRGSACSSKNDTCANKRYNKIIVSNNSGVQKSLQSLLHNFITRAIAPLFHSVQMQFKLVSWDLTKTADGR